MSPNPVLNEILTEDQPAISMGTYLGYVFVVYEQRQRERDTGAALPSRWVAVATASDSPADRAFAPKDGPQVVRGHGCCAAEAVWKAVARFRA
jgi:hypothetical protein